MISLAGVSKTSQTHWTHLSWGSYLLNGFAAVLGGAVLPQVIDGFQLNPFFGGLFVALPALGIILSGLGGGLLSSVLGTKRFLVLSLLGLAACLLTISIAPVSSVLMLGALIFGLANGMIETSGNSIIAEIHRGSAARELNRLHLIYGIGAFISPLMVAFIFSQGMAWQVSYVLVALLLVVLAILVITQPALPQTQIDKLDIGKMRTLFLQPIILQVWLGAVLLLATEQGITGWVTAYLEDINILPMKLASLGLAIFWLSMLFGRYLNTHLPTSISLRMIILAESVSAAIALLVILTSRNMIVSLMAVAFFGLSMAGLYPNVLAEASERYPGDSSVVSGIFVTGVGLGKLTGPVLIGLIATSASISSAMYLTWFLLIGLAILFSFRMKNNSSPV